MTVKIIMRMYDPIKHHILVHHIPKRVEELPMIIIAKVVKRKKIPVLDLVIMIIVLVSGVL